MTREWGNRLAGAAAATVLGGALVVAGVTGQQAHAASANANANATVLQPISISKNQDLSFGEFVPGDSGSCTVVIATGGGRTVNSPCDEIGTATGFAANFSVSGEANASYTVSLPSSISLSDGGSNTMTVDTFQSNAGASPALDGSGNDTINVGATLNVGAAQTAGTYTGTFQVTVNYQ